ncbi:MAG: glycosyltransferase family 4 protein [Candidatus Symbiobacter sp.]|nr:glycosyltransferase family 4 protein [Candidatus Symbiobacter sp.]
MLRSRLRIVVHDFPAHAFPLELSRELAARGHMVLHLYCPDFPSPHGQIAEDKSNDKLIIEKIALPPNYRKNVSWGRFMAERRYGKELAARVRAFRPDTILAGNSPLAPQAALLKAANSVQAGFVFWVQDFYSLAIAQYLQRKFGWLGKLPAWGVKLFERRLWRKSDGLIVISEDFTPIIKQAGVEPSRIKVIENWAPLSEITTLPKDQAWAKKHNISAKHIFLYAGTLGLKHNPALLVDLARSLQQYDDMVLVVASEGIGRKILEHEKQHQRLDRLILMDFQPIQELPAMLASASVLLVLLEEDAGIYSVPSKILSYACAGRPIVGAVPEANLAARLVRRQNMGIIASPSDSRLFVNAALALVQDESLATQLGKNGREFAEGNFAIKKIADRFEAVITTHSKSVAKSVSKSVGKSGVKSRQPN